MVRLAVARADVQRHVLDLGGKGCDGDGGWEEGLGVQLHVWRNHSNLHAALAATAEVAGPSTPPFNQPHLLQQLLGELAGQRLVQPGRLRLCTLRRVAHRLRGWEAVGLVRVQLCR